MHHTNFAVSALFLKFQSFRGFQIFFSYYIISVSKHIFPGSPDLRNYILTRTDCRLFWKEFSRSDAQAYGKAKSVSWKIPGEVWARTTDTAPILLADWKTAMSDPAAKSRSTIIDGSFGWIFRRMLSISNRHGRPWPWGCTSCKKLWYGHAKEHRSDCEHIYVTRTSRVLRLSPDGTYGLIAGLALSEMNEESFISQRNGCEFYSFRWASVRRITVDLLTVGSVSFLHMSVSTSSVVLCVDWIASA